MTKELTGVDCGEIFELTDEEVEKFSGTIIDEHKGSLTYGKPIQLAMPKRCFPCRVKKRARRSQN